MIIFAFTWLAAGYINVNKYDLVPLGNANILSGLMMLAFAAFFAYLGLEGVLSAVGSAWLTVNCLSWMGAFWAVTLVTYGKMKLPAAGWVAIVQAFYTLWIPTALLLIGAFSLLP